VRGNQGYIVVGQTGGAVDQKPSLEGQWNEGASKV